MQEHSPSRIVVAPRTARSSKNAYTWVIKGTATLLLLVLATVFLHGNWPVALLWVSGGIGLWGLLDTLRRQRERAAILQDVEAMPDGAFLRYAADLLRAQGYGVHAVGRAPEPRVDLLLTQGREHFVCRLQRQRRRVGKEVVTGALAAMETHGCGRAMVLANQSFTRAARRLARRAGCVLIDREALATLVVQHRQGHRVLAFHREETARLRRRK